MAEGHSARLKVMPKDEPILSEDERRALTARETQSKLSEKTWQRDSAKKTQEEEEFVMARRCRKRTNERDHKKKRGTEIQNKYDPLQEEDEEKEEESDMFWIDLSDDECEKENASRCKRRSEAEKNNPRNEGPH